MKRALVVLAACRAPVTTVANQRHAPTADEVMDGAVAAIGGAARIARIQTFHTAGSITEDDFTHNFEIWVVLPDHVRSDYSTMGHSQTSVVDGDTGWASADGYPMPFVDTMRASLLRETQGLYPSDWRKAYSNVKLVGPTTFLGQPAVAVSYDGSTHYFAPGTYRELGTSFEKLDGTVARDVLSDWRDVDGLRYPFRTTREPPDIHEIAFTTVEIDVPIPSEAFAEPASQAP